MTGDTLPMIGNRIGTAGVNRTIGSGERAMPDDIMPFDKTTEPGLSRRSFGFALGAGVAVTASAVAADKPVVETDVMIKMTDGDCDAALLALRMVMVAPDLQQPPPIRQRKLGRRCHLHRRTRAAACFPRYGEAARCRGLHRSRP